MEALMIILIFTAAAVMVVYGIVAWRAKRRAATVAKEHAEDQKNPMTAGMAMPVYTRREARNYPLSYRRPTPQAPQVVHEDNTGNMIMAGAVGYMIGSSGSHESHHTPQFDAGGGSSGGAGASSSWDDDRSSGSSSSDSGSSYSSSDSSSSDSGSSSSDSDSSSSS